MLSQIARRRGQALYREIHRCTACIGAPGCAIQLDPKRVRRKLIPESLTSDVFVVGQSLGPRTQRKSGIPYLLPTGKLSATGRRLDQFLATFGYSIDAGSGRRYAYSSDLVQHYPGKLGQGDRRPTKAGRDNCARWLRRELALVRPKVVILLGELATRDFLARYAPSTSAKVRGWGGPSRCSVGSCQVLAFAIPHPAYRFHRPEVRDIHRQATAGVLSALSLKTRSK